MIYTSHMNASHYTPKTHIHTTQKHTRINSYNDSKYYKVLKITSDKSALYSHNVNPLPKYVWREAIFTKLVKNLQQYVFSTTESAVKLDESVVQTMGHE